MAFNPANVTLTAYKGATYSERASFFSDSALTTAWPLTGYTVALVIGDYLTLTEGSGLTVDHTNATVDIYLSPTQTEGYSGDLHYELTITQASDVFVVLRGTFEFLEP